MIAIIIVAVVSFASVLAGVVALLRSGIAREEIDTSLRGEPPTLAAALTRRVVGLYVHMPQGAAQVDHTSDRTDA
jgi:hypothetical protein